jgi:hypothetical protein
LKMARKVTSGPFPDEGYCDITIPAHGRHTLEFDGAEYFEWGRSAQRQALFGALCCRSSRGFDTESVRSKRPISGLTGAFQVRHRHWLHLSTATDSSGDRMTLKNRIRSASSFCSADRPYFPPFQTNKLMECAAWTQAHDARRDRSVGQDRMPFQYQSVTGFAGNLRLEPTHRSRMTCLPVQRSRVTNTFVLFEHNVLASSCVDRKGLRCFWTWPPKPSRPMSEH